MFDKNDQLLHNFATFPMFFCWPCTSQAHGLLDNPPFPSMIFLAVNFPFQACFFFSMFSRWFSFSHRFLMISPCFPDHFLLSWNFPEAKKRLRQVLPATDDQARLLAWGAGRIAVEPWTRAGCGSNDGGIMAGDPKMLRKKAAGMVIKPAGDRSRAIVFILFFEWRPRTTRDFDMKWRVLRWTELFDHCKVNVADSTVVGAYVSVTYWFRWMPYTTTKSFFFGVARHCYPLVKSGFWLRIYCKFISEKSSGLPWNPML